jgi:hypothetical protein
VASISKIFFLPFLPYTCFHHVPQASLPEYVSILKICLAVLP